MHTLQDPPHRPPYHYLVLGHHLAWSSLLLLNDTMLVVTPRSLFMDISAAPPPLPLYGHAPPPTPVRSRRLLAPCPPPIPPPGCRLGPAGWTSGYHVWSCLLVAPSHYVVMPVSHYWSCLSHTIGHAYLTLYGHSCMVMPPPPHPSCMSDLVTSSLHVATHAAPSPHSRLLAESCWAGEPTLRPSATALVIRLKQLHEESCSCVATATARPAALERGLRAF